MREADSQSLFSESVKSSNLEHKSNEMKGSDAIYSRHSRLFVRDFLIREFAVGFRWLEGLCAPLEHV